MPAIGIALGLAFAKSSGPLGPVNSILPLRDGSGDELVGATLTCTPGTWTGTGTVNLTYQWFNSNGSIAAATSLTYDLTSTDAGLSVWCVETATDDNGSDSASTASYVTRALGVVNTSGPQAETDSGSAPANLTCSDGSWVENPTGNTPTFSYLWYGPNAGGTSNAMTANDPGDYYCAVTATPVSGSPVMINSDTLSIA